MVFISLSSKRTMRHYLFKFKRITTFVFVNIFLLSAAHGEASFKKGLSRSEATTDFRIMQKVFAQAHASAFAQIPPGEGADIFHEKVHWSTREFIAEILKYYRNLKVDHTGLALSTKLIEDLALKYAFFPFPLQFFNGRAYFDSDAQGIPFGSELLELNGQAVPEIWKEFSNVFSLQNKDRRWQDTRLSDSFSFLYYIVKGDTSEWRIVFKSENKIQRTTLRIDRSKPPLAIARVSSKDPRRKDILFKLFNKKLKTSYLAINSFMPRGTELDSIDQWNRALNGFLKEAGDLNAEYLILDLRANRGGVMLFSAAASAWFIDRVVQDRNRSRSRARLLPYRQYVTSINSLEATEKLLSETESHLETSFADTRQGDYFPTRKKNARFLEIFPFPHAHRFKKIYILTSKNTYSAAVNFARLVKLGNSNAILVGEESGSPGDGHSAEILVSYKLPNSGVFFEIPLIRVDFDPTLPGQKKGEGLPVDIKLYETAQDFVQGRDTVLEKLTSIIKKEQ